MKSGVKVTADRVADVLASLRQLDGMDVLVGIPEDKAARDDGSPMSNAELGYLHSTGGTIEIPEHTTTVYRQVDKNGDLKHGGKFVKASKSNLATTHIVPAQTITLPPRPFLEMGIEDSKPQTTVCLKNAAIATLDGRPEAAMRELESAGQIARDASKAVIGAGDRLHPLSEKTLERRRGSKPPIPGDKPLYVTGSLLKSINYVVRKK
jgi:hypothetical protein